jgi:hypothetical protein
MRPARAQVIFDYPHNAAVRALTVHGHAESHVPSHSRWRCRVVANEDIEECLTCAD